MHGEDRSLQAGCGRQARRHLYLPEPGGHALAPGQREPNANGVVSEGEEVTPAELENIERDKIEAEIAQLERELAIHKRQLFLFDCFIKNGMATVMFRDGSRNTQTITYHKSPQQMIWNISSRAFHMAMQSLA
jgi:hypothetical protein